MRWRALFEDANNRMPKPKFTRSLHEVYTKFTRKLLLFNISSIERVLLISLTMCEVYMDFVHYIFNTSLDNE